MYKVLIVDDDSFARTDIKNMLEWEKNGFLIVGEASNGAGALQIIESEMPDIVITDMFMPVMNGVELIGVIKKEYPQIRVIALSAYNDFDYVRQSMKKGAVDYVLKHQLDSSTLAGILETAADSILRYRDECSQRSIISEQLSSSTVILVKEFLQKLVLGEVSDKKEITRKLSSLNIGIDTENLVVAVVEIDNFRFIEEKFSSKEKSTLINTFQEISQEILNDWEKSCINYMEKGKFVIIFSLGAAYSMLYVYNRLYNVIDRIRTAVKRYLNITACFSFSRVYRHVSEISKAFSEADNMLKEKFYKGKDAIYIENSLAKQENNFFCLDIKDERDIVMALRELDYKGLEKHIGRIFDKILEMRLGSKSTQMICAELINIVNKVSKEVGLEISNIYMNEDIPYNMMQKYETVGDIKIWILSIYAKLISMLEEMKVDSEYCEITKRVLEFINRNYKKGISLSDAADFTGVSNSYISRVFKEDLGMGFVEYLNHTRVEKAKQLIENSGDKLKEIVSKVGFNNYNYFFKVFKEITGMTPVEYDQTCKKS